MVPPVHYKKATLSYPVYSVDFDPYNPSNLVVGGGGGEGRSGVSNKITLLDTTSSGKTLDVLADIELSRDEDSVTTLATLAAKNGLIALTGINSSEADQKTGKNEHLRAFEIKYPKRRRIAGKTNITNGTDEKGSKDFDGAISLIGKSSLFKPATGPKPEQYQRLLRLSPAQKLSTGNKRIGAIATGLAKDSQLVIFDASRVPAKESEIINAITLPEEVADLDITTTLPSEFSVAWCSDYDVFEQTVQYDFQTRTKQITPTNPRRVHSIPRLDAAGKPKTEPRPKYRSIRFLTDHHLLVLANSPNKSGAELFIMHLYPTGPAAVLFHKVLPSHIKQAVGLDVCALDPDEIGSRQYVVAVAAQDISIEVYTINYTRQTDTFSPFRPFTTLRDVHPLQMTAIRFAPFFKPETPKEAPKSQVVKDHHIHLASVSMGNTVVLDSFAIHPLVASKSRSRFVLSHPSTERLTKITYSALISFIVLISAMLIQSAFFPEQGQALVQRLPQPIQRMFGGQPLKFGDVPNPASPIIATAHKLQDLLHLHSDSPSKAVILREPVAGTTDLGIEVVPNREEYLVMDTQAKRWEQLAEHEQNQWRETLVKAGRWTVDEGEAVFKGILFSSYANLVGQVAGEAIRNL